jgi:hypothetical protein
MNQCTYLYSPNDGTNDPAEYLKNVPSLDLVPAVAHRPRFGQAK